MLHVVGQRTRSVAVATRNFPELSRLQLGRAHTLRPTGSRPVDICMLRLLSCLLSDALH